MALGGIVRTAILARVSSAQQLDNLSIPAQRRALRDFCAARGWEIVREVEAPAESASTHELARRPSVVELLALAESRQIDVVVYHESSRVARNVEMASLLLRRLRAQGVRLVNAAMPDVDLETPEGEAMFKVSSVFDEYTAHKLGQQIRKGKRERWMSGLHVGSIPFGYRYQLRDNPDGTRTPATDLPLEQVPEEAAALRWAFSARSRGVGYMEIADEWHRRGLRPRSRGNVGSGRFGQRGVEGVLNNPFYAGRVSHAGQERPGAHEAIVSEADWHAARAGRSLRQAKAGSFRDEVLLMSVARCSGCGRGLRTGGQAGRWTYYQERSDEHGWLCVNRRTSWRTQEPDALVERLMLAIALEPRWLDYVNERAQRAPVDRGAKRRRELEQQQQRLMDMAQQALIPLADYRSRMDRINGELAELAPVSPAQRVGAIEELQSFGALWWELGMRERGEAVRMLLRAVVLDTRAKAVVRVEPQAGRFAELFESRREWCAGLAFEHPAQAGPENANRLYTLAELGVSA